MSKETLFRPFLSKECRLDFQFDDDRYGLRSVLTPWNLNSKGRDGLYFPGCAGETGAVELVLQVVDKKAKSKSKRKMDFVIGLAKLFHMFHYRNPVIVYVGDEVEIKIKASPCEKEKQRLERLVSPKRQLAKEEKVKVPQKEITKKVHLHVDDGAKERLKILLQKARDEQDISFAKAFAHFDKEGSGFLSKDDFQQGLRDLGFNLTVKDLMILFHELDRNHDGRISMSEFLAFAELEDPEVDEEDRRTKAEEKQKTPKHAGNDNNVTFQVSLLDKCRERIRDLEKRCAEAEANNHLAITRAVRDARNETSRKFEDEFVKKISLRLRKEYGHSLEEEAHLAFAEMLEEELRDLKKTCREQKVALEKETRRADVESMRRHRIERFIYTNKSWFQPTIGNMSKRSSYLIRQLFLLSPEDLWDYEITAKNEEDFKQLQTDLVQLEWCRKPFLGKRVNKTNLMYIQDKKEFLRALERAKDWDMDYLLNKGEQETKLFQRKEEELSIPTKLLDICATKISKYENAPASSLFEGMFSLVPTSSVEMRSVVFADLNDQLVRKHVPAFGSTREFEEAMLWMIQRKRNGNLWENQREDGQLWRTWQEHGRVLVHEFCQLLDIVADTMETNKQVDFLQSLLIAEEKTMETKQHEDQEQPMFENQKHWFSPSEHSSCWPPLLKFGKVPYDCVRLLNDNLTVEHNTTRSRNVMAFVHGDISVAHTNTIFFKMERGLMESHHHGQSYWALCVTSEPPANRPVRGSAVYQHNGEAKIEGSNEVGKTIMYTDCDNVFASSECMVATTILQHIRRDSESDEHAFERVYGRFAPKRLVHDIIHEVRKFVSERIEEGKSYPKPIQNEEPDFAGFVWQARELEAKLRMEFPKEVERQTQKDHWTLDNVFVKLMSDEGFGGGTLIQAANLLYGEYKELLDIREWRELVAPLLDDQSSTFSKGVRSMTFDQFMRFMHDLEQRIQAQFNVSPTQITKFKETMNKHFDKNNRSQPLHCKPIQFGDVVGAVVDITKGSVKFYLNNKFQLELFPTCRKPWRFAWFTNRHSRVSIVQPKEILLEAQQYQ